MNTPLKHPAVKVFGIAVVAAVVGLVIWKQFDLGTTWTISQRVDELANAQHIETARDELTKTPRGPTIEALKAALESDGGTPWGKFQVLQLLSQFKESRTVMRALESKEVTTQRAAAYLRQTDKSVAPEVSAIAMQWLKDKGAVDRRLAVMILRTMDERAAIPELISILEAEGKRPESAAMVVHILDAMGTFKPDGVAPAILALASDSSIEPAVRNRAMGALTHLPDTPKDELLKILMEIAQDESANSTMRKNAFGLIASPAYATPEGWEVLRNIVLDPNNSTQSQQTLQRKALWSLAASYPLDKLQELLLDRRVYAHPFFGIRTDVACGIGHLRIQSRLALQILTELLAEEDPGDFLTNVPREAWLAFWAITGVHSGSSRPELFSREPARVTDDDALRQHLFSISFSHPSISKAQADALDGFTVTLEDNNLRRTDPQAFRDLRAEKFEKRKAISQMYRAEIDKIVAAWEKPK
jgi:HEAT repeat protein